MSAAEIIAFLKERRLKKKISIRRLAAATGVDRRTIDDNEMGIYKPRLDTLIAWVEELNCRIEVVSND